MPSSRPNPTASRRALAARLRRMRLAAGKSTEDAARELMVSASKISRLESGERTPQPRDVRDLARYYGASEAEVEHLHSLVLEARRRGWWDHYATEDDQAKMFIGLETAASSIDTFEVVRWPGLLQTPAITDAVLRGMQPPGVFTPNFIDDQVSLRQDRQRRVLDLELQYHAVLDESIFYRPMGDGVVAGQIAKIVEWVIGLPNVTVQVVPENVGPHPGLNGAFSILRYQDEPDLGDTVFIEGNVGSSFFEGKDSLDGYQRVFEILAGQYAMDPWTVSTG